MSKKLEYKFTDGSGSTVTDTIAANRGTLTNSPTWATNPNRVTLNGTNQSLYSSVSGLPTRAPLTLHQFIKPSGTGAAKIGEMWDDGSGNHDWLAQVSGGAFNFRGRVSNTDHVGDENSGTLSISASHIHELLCTCSAGGTVRLFLDGTELSVTQSTSANSTADSTAIGIGAGTSGGTPNNSWFAGDFVYAAVYDTDEGANAAALSKAVIVGTITPTLSGGTVTITNSISASVWPSSSLQWYRDTTNNFTPGGGNILTGQTALTLTDVPGGGTFFYVLVAALDGRTVTSNYGSTASVGDLAVGSVTSTSAAFSWTSVGATTTHLQLASDSTFAVLLVDADMTGLSTKAIGTLMDSSTYYARLTTDGNPSNVVNFTTPSSAATVPIETQSDVECLVLGVL